jgi:hypothetical protein
VEGIIHSLISALKDKPRDDSCASLDRNMDSIFEGNFACFSAAKRRSFLYKILISKDYIQNRYLLTRNSVMRMRHGKFSKIP